MPCREDPRQASPVSSICVSTRGGVEHPYMATRNHDRYGVDSDTERRMSAFCSTLLHRSAWCRPRPSRCRDRGLGVTAARARRAGAASTNVCPVSKSLLRAPAPMDGTGRLGVCSKASKTGQIDVGEASIYLRHGADGPPVLLLHGPPRTSATWHRVAPQLVQRGFTVVCSDLRGYGRSRGPAPTSDHTAHSKRAVAGT